MRISLAATSTMGILYIQVDIKLAANTEKYSLPGLLKYKTVHCTYTAHSSP